MTGTELSPAMAAKRAGYRTAALRAAEELFAEHGVEGTRIELIAARAHMAPRTLYTVFTSKQALVDAVDEHHRSALVAIARDVVGSASTAWSALLGTVDVATRYYLDHPDHLRQELRQPHSWADERSSRSTAWHEAFGSFTRLFERAMAAGDVRAGDPAAHARALLALQQSQLAHWVASGMKAPHEDVVADLHVLVRHAFATDPATPSPPHHPLRSHP